MGYGDEITKLHTLAGMAGELAHYLDSGYEGVVPEEHVVGYVARDLSEMIERLLDLKLKIERSAVMRIGDAVCYPYDAVISFKARSRFFFVAEPSRWQLTKHPGLATPYEIDADNRVPFAIYVDTGVDEKDEDIVAHVEEAIEDLGFSEFTDVEIVRESFFKSWRAKAQEAASATEVKELLAKVERGLELQFLDQRQSQVDHAEAQAAGTLIASLENTPTACLRVGSILLLKYQKDGLPIVLIRNLSQVEMAAIGKYPEIQRNPEKALELLAAAVDSLEILPPHGPSEPGGPAITPHY